MPQRRWVKRLILPVLLLVGFITCVVLSILLGPRLVAARPPGPSPAHAAGDYVVLAWNDLGMHCYNGDFQDLAVLPPFNTLWAQVVRVGDPPAIITTGITITYVFTDNTYSVGKTNFWEYVQPLFGVVLPPNVGLAGKGLSGQMDLQDDHFEAVGIPLTEYRDSDLVNRYPYQTATIIAYDSSGELARTIAVAPVSTEMHCDNCHGDTGDATTRYPITPTGRVETNILTLHDYLSMSSYPPGHDGPLMDRRPILCAECHASNALRAPGVAGVSNLSHAIHAHHSDLEDITPDTDGCYNCHPGPGTRCLRDVMSQQVGMNCTQCHGLMGQVALNPAPWLREPRCDNCHGAGYQQDQALYRMSKEHGGILCAACHDSPHAIAPSREPNDAIKFEALQGHAGTLIACTVCHRSMPVGPGPHGIPAPTGTYFTFGQDRLGTADPGMQVAYVHGLKNVGNVSDTYALTWSSSQGWAAASGRVYGLPFAVPGQVTLQPNEAAFVFVTVTVPATNTVRGLIDTTIVTVTSGQNAAHIGRVTDITLVPAMRCYLPLIWR